MQVVRDSTVKVLIILMSNKRKYILVEFLRKKPPYCAFEQECHDQVKRSLQISVDVLVYSMLCEVDRVIKELKEN